MPKINGFELYNQLKSRDVKIKTLFPTALSSMEDYSTQPSELYPKKGERHFASHFEYYLICVKTHKDGHNNCINDSRSQGVNKEWVHLKIS
jgi:hypothetical protein